MLLHKSIEIWDIRPFITDLVGFGKLLSKESLEPRCYPDQRFASHVGVDEFVDFVHNAIRGVNRPVWDLVDGLHHLLCKI